MQYPNETSLKELLRVLRRALIPAAVIAVGLGALTYYLRGQVSDIFAATSTLVLSSGSAPASAIGITLLTSPMIDVTAYRTAIESPAMLNDALRSLGVENPSGRDRSSLLSQISVGIRQTPASSLIEIETYSTTPEGAVRVGMAVTEALIAWDQQRAVRSLDSIVETLSAQIQALEEQIRITQTSGGTEGRVNALITSQNSLIQQRDAALALRTSAVGRLEVLAPPVEPERPISSRRMLYTVAAALLGAVGVFAIYLIRNALDSRMRNSDDFFAETGVPVLAEFARPRRPVQFITLEEANYLGASITFGHGSEEPKVILVASVEPGEGSSSVAFGLAASIATNAQNVLMVDADLRTPVSKEAFALPFGAMTSFDEYLSNPRQSLVAIDHKISGSPYLHVVPSYKSVSNAPALLVRGFRSRVQEWSASFDVILVHAPPLLAVADGLIMAPYCTGVLLVCDLKVTNRNRVTRALRLLERLEVPILGAATTGGDWEQERVHNMQSKAPRLGQRRTIGSATARRR